MDERVRKGVSAPCRDPEGIERQRRRTGNLLRENGRAKEGAPGMALFLWQIDKKMRRRTR
jgi:hypothetical protein